MKISNLIKYCISIPKTIVFNFLAFDLKKAIHMPVIVSYDTKLGKIHRNCIILNNYDKSRYRILFGFGGSKHIISNRYSILDYGKNARIVFNGKCYFAKGMALRVDVGKISFGKNVSFNKNCRINCEKSITICDNVLVGAEVDFRDSDGHYVYENGQQKENEKSVFVDKNVWICSHASILKGAIIKRNSIVAFKSVVLKKFEEENILIGGYPAKILRRNISWKQ